jgi:hypothetical protein
MTEPESSKQKFYCPVRGCSGHTESWHMCLTNCTWACSALNTWTWETSCGKTFWLDNEATPQTIGFKYCGFCGHRLEQQI